MTERLDFTIEPEIFKSLLNIQSKIPPESTGTFKKGAASGYSNPAALALLGAKDGKLDTVIKLNMSGGCWDAPNINHDDMDKGLRKMIDTERIVTGMCLIRHPTFQGEWPDKFGVMPAHMKGQIHSMRHAFSDITQTVWIVLHKGYFRLYRPTRGADGRIGVAEMRSDYLIEDAKDDEFVAKKLAADKKAKIEKALKKKLIAQKLAEQKLRQEEALKKAKKKRKI